MRQDELINKVSGQKKGPNLVLGHAGVTKSLTEEPEKRIKKE